MTDRDYQHSRPLDVHRWSEHKEANGFVDYVYDTYLNTQSNENQRIKKRHLKVVLLDLYVAWLNEVTQKARIKVKFNQNLTKTQLYAHGAQDRDWFLDMFQSLFKSNPTNGYQRRLERHRKQFEQ